MKTIDQLVFAAYLAAVAGVGLFAWRRRAAHPEASAAAEYLLAGRAVSLPGFVFTLVATWYGGVLGVGEYSFKHGLSNWLVFGVPYYLAAALFAVFLAGRARRSGALTIPEQVRRAYGRGPGLIAAAVVAATAIPAAYVLELGVLLRLVFGLPLWAGIAVASAFSLTYLWRSGFHGVVRTDALQFFLMFGGFLLIVPLLVAEHGLLPFLAERVPAEHLTWSGGVPAGSIVVWYLIALSTLVEPAFYQRCFAARNERVARLGLVVSIACWALFDALTTATGLYARALLTDLPAAQATEAFPLLATRVLPAGLCGLFFVSMAATVLSTVDSYQFIVASTFGRDLVGYSRRWRERIPEATRIGLVLSAIAAGVFAWLSQSVVGLWHGFGSVSTATLLLPVVGTFVPALRLSPRGALAHLIVVGATTSAWLLSRVLIGGDFPLGIEPIYVGFGSGALVLALDRALAPRAANERPLATE